MENSSGWDQNVGQGLPRSGLVQVHDWCTHHCLERFFIDYYSVEHKQRCIVQCELAFIHNEWGKIRRSQFSAAKMNTTLTTKSAEPCRQMDLEGIVRKRKDSQANLEVFFIRF